MEEIEVKFLDIDPKALERKLISLGAKKVFDRKFRRIVFDHPDLRLNDEGAWLRLRDEGERVTLTFKQRLGQQTHDGSTSDQSMLEQEVTVSDFDTTAAIIRSIGLADKFYEENRRTQYKLGDVELDIDFWPLLNPYLEIEAKSWAEIDETIERLELNPEDKKIFSTYQIYQLAGIDENDYKIMTFERQIKKNKKHLSS